MTVDESLEVLRQRLTFYVYVGDGDRQADRTETRAGVHVGGAAIDDVMNV